MTLKIRNVTCMQKCNYQKNLVKYKGDGFLAALDTYYCDCLIDVESLIPKNVSILQEGALKELLEDDEND